MTSVPPSETASMRAASASVQPMDVDVPLALTEEELQDQANEWARLVRSFVKGKSTRQRNHDALLAALCDAAGADLPSLVLARSGLYVAVRALGDQSVAGEMFAAVDAAKALADRWEEEFRAGALEEEV
ncbi:hypothetical protein PENSPDRAFT_693981 [Peniophora sp. CONT]|nr:hypothetical protein PENSPDRAFT_693981 [Peniophora sp. CONT]